MSLLVPIRRDWNPPLQKSVPVQGMEKVKKGGKSPVDDLEKDEMGNPDYSYFGRNKKKLMENSHQITRHGKGGKWHVSQDGDISYDKPSAGFTPKPVVDPEGKPVKPFDDVHGFMKTFADAAKRARVKVPLHVLSKMAEAAHEAAERATGDHRSLSEKGVSGDNEKAAKQKVYSEPFLAAMKVGEEFLPGPTLRPLMERAAGDFRDGVSHHLSDGTHSPIGMPLSAVARHHVTGEERRDGKDTKDVLTDEKDKNYHEALTKYTQQVKGSAGPASGSKKWSNDINESVNKLKETGKHHAQDVKKMRQRTNEEDAKIPVADKEERARKEASRVEADHDTKVPPLSDDELQKLGNAIMELHINPDRFAEIRGLPEGTRSGRHHIVQGLATEHESESAKVENERQSAETVLARALVRGLQHRANGHITNGIQQGGSKAWHILAHGNTLKDRHQMARAVVDGAHNEPENSIASYLGLDSMRVARAIVTSLPDPETYAKELMAAGMVPKEIKGGPDKIAEKKKAEGANGTGDKPKTGAGSPGVLIVKSKRAGSRKLFLEFNNSHLKKSRMSLPVEVKPSHFGLLYKMANTARGAFSTPKSLETMGYKLRDAKPTGTILTPEKINQYHSSANAGIVDVHQQYQQAAANNDAPAMKQHLKTLSTLANRRLDAKQMLNTPNLTKQNIPPAPSTKLTPPDYDALKPHIDEAIQDHQNFMNGQRDTNINPTSAPMSTEDKLRQIREGIHAQKVQEFNTQYPDKKISLRKMKNAQGAALAQKTSTHFEGMFGNEPGQQYLTPHLQAEKETKEAQLNHFKDDPSMTRTLGGKLAWTKDAVDKYEPHLADTSQSGRRFTELPNDLRHYSNVDKNISLEDLQSHNDPNDLGYLVNQGTQNIKDDRARRGTDLDKDREDVEAYEGNVNNFHNTLSELEKTNPSLAEEFRHPMTAQRHEQVMAALKGHHAPSAFHELSANMIRGSKGEKDENGNPYQSMADRFSSLDDNEVENFKKQHGLRIDAERRRINGQYSPQDIAGHYLWAKLSQNASPFEHETGYANLTAHPEFMDLMHRSANGNFNDDDAEKMKKIIQSKEYSPEDAIGSGNYIPANPANAPAEKKSPDRALSRTLGGRKDDEEIKPSDIEGIMRDYGKKREFIDHQTGQPVQRNAWQHLAALHNDPSMTMEKLGREYWKAGLGSHGFDNKLLRLSGGFAGMGGGAPVDSQAAVMGHPEAWKKVKEMYRGEKPSSLYGALISPYNGVSGLAAQEQLENNYNHIGSQPDSKNWFRDKGFDVPKNDQEEADYEQKTGRKYNWGGLVNDGVWLTNPKQKRDTLHDITQHGPSITDAGLRSNVGLENNPRTPDQVAEGQYLDRRARESIQGGKTSNDQYRTGREGFGINDLHNHFSRIHLPETEGKSWDHVMANLGGYKDGEGKYNSDHVKKGNDMVDQLRDYAQKTHGATIQTNHGPSGTNFGVLGGEDVSKTGEDAQRIGKDIANHFSKLSGDRYSHSNQIRVPMSSNSRTGLNYSIDKKVSADDLKDIRKKIQDTHAGAHVNVVDGNLMVTSGKSQTEGDDLHSEEKVKKIRQILLDKGVGLRMKTFNEDPSEAAHVERYKWKGYHHDDEKDKETGQTIYKGYDNKDRRWTVIQNQGLRTEREGNSGDTYGLKRPIGKGWRRYRRIFVGTEIDSLWH